MGVRQFGIWGFQSFEIGILAFFELEIGILEYKGGMKIGIWDLTPFETRIWDLTPFEIGILVFQDPPLHIPS